MRATKVLVTITVEGLSVDILRGMVAKAIEQIQSEFDYGELKADDGDSVRWNVERTPVVF